MDNEINYLNNYQGTNNILKIISKKRYSFIYAGVFAILVHVILRRLNEPIEKLIPYGTHRSQLFFLHIFKFY